MRSLRTLAVAVIATGLLGCSLLIDRRGEVTVYAPAIEQQGQPGVSQRAHAWQLVVAQPHAIAPLDGTHIVVAPVPGEIEYYKGARWREAAPAMLQDLVLQALHDFSGLSSAVAPASGVVADYLLLSDLRDFQAEYRGAKTPIVVVRITLQLVRYADASVVAARTFAVEEPCRTERIADVFAAFQSSINKLLLDVVEWSVAEADRQSSTVNAAATPASRER